MRIKWLAAAVLLLFSMVSGGQAKQMNASDLRLIPFPKQVKVMAGQLTLSPGMRITVSDVPAARQAASELQSELTQIAGVSSTVEVIQSRAKPIARVLILSSDKSSEYDLGKLGTLPQQAESYWMMVKRDKVIVASTNMAGLTWGIQTLRQLIRANLNGKSIPCLSIIDYPSLQYRGFQDDITRGASPKLATLKSEVQVGSLLKMNFFTYYIEHQFEFKKHPLIGPKDGSLTAAELKKLVQYAQNFNVDIIGCQQSFGHFYHILKHEKYSHLKEGTDCLNPTNEGTYQLLDDMFSEQMPSLKSKFFNICCDETVELGKGPSKALADKIGVGGVYTQHINRVYDLVAKKYGKRMMMWQDIILQHPEHLDKIPKDIIMLAWGYHRADSFEPSVTPFAKAGYDFFVCPGVNNWSRILPDFETAVINIHNYVRDGAKHGAMGMLNTTWLDDGESLQGCNWHGVAWGAECAWNASTTPIEDFNRRIGAVLFGEKGDHFGQAISLLSKAHTLPGYNAMMNARFWQESFGQLPMDRATEIKQAESLLNIVDPALKHLQLLKKEAKYNKNALDCMIFGADRMKLMATRQLDFIKAADICEQATQVVSEPEKAAALMQQSINIIKKIRDQHADLKTRYAALWSYANKPYALDWTLSRYDDMIGRYNVIFVELARANLAFRTSGILPSLNEIVMEVIKLKQAH